MKVDSSKAENENAIKEFIHHGCEYANWYCSNRKMHTKGMSNMMHVKIYLKWKLDQRYRKLNIFGSENIFWFSLVLHSFFFSSKNDLWNVSNRKMKETACDCIQANVKTDLTFRIRCIKTKIWIETVNRTTTARPRHIASK